MGNYTPGAQSSEIISCVLKKKEILNTKGHNCKHKRLGFIMASQQEDFKPDSYAYSETDPYSGSSLEWSTYWFWSSHSSLDSHSNSDSDSDSDLHTEQSDQGQPTPSSSKDPGMSDGNVDNKMSSSTKKPSSSYATFSEIPSTAEQTLSSVSTRPPSEGSYKPESTAALSVAIPSVAAIFILLLFVCFILLWKKTHNGNRSEQDSAKSGDKGLGKVKEVQKIRGQTSVEMSVTSWNHYTHSSSDGERKDDAQYAEREETSQPIANGNSPWGEEVFSFANYNDNAQGTHEYEEANIPSMQMNNGYEKTKTEGPQIIQGYEKTAKRGTPNDTGYGTEVVTGPFYQTLNSAYLSDSNGSSFREKSRWQIRLFRRATESKTIKIENRFGL